MEGELDVEEAGYLRLFRIGRVAAVAFLGLLLCSSTARATSLPPNISADTTLSLAGSPYTGSSIVSPGVTLTVDPGVEFTKGTLTIQGTLKAVGTTESSIVFNGVPIKFEPGSGGSVLSRAEVKLVKKSETAAVETNSSSPTIEHSDFSNNQSSAIKVTKGGSPEIAHNVFKGNGHYYLGRTTITYSAAAAEPGVVNIHDNVVEDGGYAGISVTSNTNPPGPGGTLGDNVLIGNEGPGLTYSGTDIPGNITANLLEGNESDDIQVSGTVAHSSTWEAGGSPLRIGSSGVVLASGATLHIGPAVYIREPELTVNGTLLVEGTANRPVAFVGDEAEVAGEWGGVDFGSGSGESRLEFVEVAFGGKGRPMINIKGVSPTIIHSTLRRSAGDAVRVQQSGQPLIEGNRFRSNQFGLRYEGEGSLSAPKNDWGCANGPKPAGCGDSVTSNVLWQPAAVLQELPRLCPGTTMLASSAPCLLQKYQPELRYDSEENYFADSAAGITDNWGDEENGLWGENKSAGPYTNSLFDGDTEAEAPNFGLLAQSQPGVAWLPYQLTLPALGAKYPNGQVADSNDWLVENGNYVEDSHALEEAGYIHASYGHLVTDTSGKKWLEYWYWYYYNPKSFGGFGAHEGDWETILVGLDSSDKPEQVLFSQHAGAAECAADELDQTAEGGPVAYVALDSHATYPLDGSYETEADSDYADGLGVSVQPGLVIVGSSPPSWILWPGHWGNSRAEIAPLESDSPQGPAFHEAWGSPVGYAEGARECFENFEVGEDLRALLASPETAPRLEGAELVNGVPRVSYRVPAAAGKGYWPRLRVTIDQLDDGGLPPVSRTISPGREVGEVSVSPVGITHGERVLVRGSVVYKNGRRVHLSPEALRLR